MEKYKYIDNSKIPMKKIFLFLIVGIFLFSLISANTLSTMGVIKKGTCLNIPQSCASCSYINLSIQYPNKTIAISNQEMISQGAGLWIYEFCLTDDIGRYDITGQGDINGENKSFDVLWFEVTSSGRPVSGYGITANIILFLFFIILILSFYFITKNINYEKWHNSIISRWEYRNYVKVIISSIGYNMMKNSFIWYYLFGLPIILIITDISYTFGVESMIELTQIILAIYWYGFIVVGIFFFGYLQEWVMKIIDEIKSMDFGV